MGSCWKSSLRLRQSNFHLASVFFSKSHVSRIEEKRVRKKADPGIGRMMCLSNYYMQGWPLAWSTWPQAFWAHSTVSVNGFATWRPNMYPYMTYLTKILWFCRLLTCDQASLFFFAAGRNAWYSYLTIRLPPLIKISVSENVGNAIFR